MKKLRQLLGGMNILERLLVLLLLIGMVSSGCYMYWGYMINSDALVNGIDKRLLLAAMTFQQMLPDEVIDRCAESDAGSYSLEALQRLPAPHPLRRLFDQTEVLRRNAGLEYLYTVLQKADGSYRFPFGLAVGSNVPYEDPAPDIVLTLQDGLIRNTLISDPEFGASRSVIIRQKTARGNYYIIGADALLSEVEAAKHDAFLTFLGISLATFGAMIILGMILARRLSQPIRRLSRFTIELRNSEFAKEEPMPADLLPANPTEARFEVKQLALNIDLFRHALQETTEKKERAESELRIAGQIQQNFLPAPVRANCGVDIAGVLQPALEAGGDLFDYMTLPDGRVYFAIGDVCGKGMPAALFMAMTLTLMRAGIRQGLPLQQFMQFVNDNLASGNENCTFVTLLCAKFDSAANRIAYCNGGNCPPVLILPGAAPVLLAMPQEPPLAVMEGMSYAVHDVEFPPGAVMVLFTDGISEAVAADGSFYGTGRLLACLSGVTAGESSEKIRARVLADVAAFTDGQLPSDDITLVVVQHAKR